MPYFSLKILNIVIKDQTTQWLMLLELYVLITRRRNGSIFTPDEYQDIKDVIDGRKYLEKYSLLFPPGELLSNSALAICLHQIVAMVGLPKQAINTIWSTTFLLEELEEIAINETIRMAFNSQIMEFTVDMKLLANNTKEKVWEQIKEQIKELAEQVTWLSNQVQSNPINQSNEAEIRMPKSYAAALINPPLNMNPKLAAREGIRAWQFVLKGINKLEFSQYNSQQLKAQLNKAVKELGMKEGKMCSLMIQKNGNTLIEVESDTSAKWFTNILNRTEFCTRLGKNISFKPRLYNVLALNSPLTIDPEGDKPWRDKWNQRPRGQHHPSHTILDQMFITTGQSSLQPKSVKIWNLPWFLAGVMTDWYWQTSGPI